MGTPIKANLQIISPDVAKRLLAHNTNNRLLNKRNVKRYAADIKAGVWRINGEPIIDASDGTLLDAQHRLHAVIEASESIQTLLITGIDPRVSNTIDTGRPKSIADHLTMMGYTNAVRRHAVSRLLHAWEEGRPLGNVPSRAPSVHEAVEIMGRWEPALTHGIRCLELCAGNRHGIYPSTLIVFFTLASCVNTDRAEVFATQFAHGAGLDVGHPVLHLRTHLTTQLARKTTYARNQHLAWLTQAWSAVCEGKTRRRYQRSAPLTKFPGLIGRTGKTK